MSAQTTHQYTPGTRRWCEISQVGPWQYVENSIRVSSAKSLVRPDVLPFWGSSGAPTLACVFGGGDMGGGCGGVILSLSRTSHTRSIWGLFGDQALFCWSGWMYAFEAFLVFLGSLRADL